MRNAASEGKRGVNRRRRLDNNGRKEERSELVERLALIS